MPRDWIIAYLALPMTAGLLCLLFTGRRRAQAAIGLASLVCTLLVAAWGLTTVYHGPDVPGAILVSQAGNWPAPFGISLVLDTLSAFMLFITVIVSLAVFIYCLGRLPPRVRGGFFHPLFHLLLLGVHWSFLTGDLFNLFVAFEIMLMASYVLLVAGTTRLQMRQAYKYVLLNLFSSLLFVTCCGLVYAQLGTLNLADLARLNRQHAMPPQVLPVFAVLLIVFGTKTAIFPLWFWLPDTYPTVHAAIGGLFAGLLTKVGAYVMVRIFVMTLGDPSGLVAPALSPLILASAAVTMFLGVLGAVAAQSIRRILSIHIVSQIGYMILGVGLGISAGLAMEDRLLAVAGAVFFIAHNMVVKTSLFLCGGLVGDRAGSDHLSEIGGLVRSAPLLATLFFIAALSLAGLPPLSGFFGKWVLIRQSFIAMNPLLGLVALATSLFTLLSMLKIWSYAFWSEPRGLHLAGLAPPRGTRLGMAAAALLVVVALTMGLGATAYLNVSRAAARSVVDVEPYIRAVLGDAAVQSPGQPHPVALLPVEAGQP